MKLNTAVIEQPSPFLICPSSLLDEKVLCHTLLSVESVKREKGAELGTITHPIVHIIYLKIRVI